MGVCRVSIPSIEDGGSRGDSISRTGILRMSWVALFIDPRRQLAGPQREFAIPKRRLIGRWPRQMLVCFVLQVTLAADGVPIDLQARE